MKEIKDRPKRSIIIYILIAIVLFWVSQNSAPIWQQITKFFGILTPFIFGGVVAFILNIPMVGIEKLLTKIFKEPKKWFRIVSVISSFLILFGVLAFVVVLVIPDLVVTLTNFISNVPKAVTSFQDFLGKTFNDNPEIMDTINQLNIDWTSMQTNVINYVRDFLLTALSSTIKIAVQVVGGVFNFFVIMVFSVYILLAKETLLRQISKLIYAFMSTRRANKLMDISKIVATTFHSFVSGQLIEAIIQGFLVYIGMTIFNFPYALSISVITGVTSLIPYFGAIIGGIIGALLIALQNFNQGLFFIIFIVVVQQIEGNVLYPRVVGDSVGLPGIWVMVAVSVGGEMFGLVGMIVMVPVAAVIYKMLSLSVNKRIDDKAQDPQEKLAVTIEAEEEVINNT